MIVRSKVKEATRGGVDILLTGVTMGGGPSHWAVEDHLKSGFQTYATPAAARSFNDDLDEVREMGIQVVSEDEAIQLESKTMQIELLDFDFVSIQRSLGAFGVSLDGLAAVAVAVFDHGDAPPGYSDRQFRFDYLDARILAENRLSAFAYHSKDVPKIMTRLQAVVKSARGVDAPLVVMDTAPAAVMGAMLDMRLASQNRVQVVNVGNFHTLAFRLGPGGIEGVFEHHTGLIDLPKLESLLVSLADSSLTHETVFDDHGHGALVYDSNPLSLSTGEFGVAVTGPRRNLMHKSTLRPYFAVPFGDMMIAGCFGLLSATADLLPEVSEPIRESLRGAGGSGTPPWELN